MFDTANPWWWQRWISVAAVTRELEADPEYARLNRLLDNKRAHGDIAALKYVIMAMNDLCEETALSHYLNRRDGMVIISSILSAACSVVYFVARSGHRPPVMQAAAATGAIFLFALAGWVRFRTPFVIQRIVKTKPIRSAVALKGFLEHMGYQVTLTAE